MSTTVNIKAVITRDIPNDGEYRVTVTIIETQNIAFDVLVFNTEHDEFEHVATVYDIDTYPANRETAIAQNLAYYRTRVAVVTYDNIREATAFESVTRSRLKRLAVAYSSIVDAFTGTEVVSVTSSTTT